MARRLVMDVHEPEAIADRLRDLGTEPAIRTIHPGDYVLGPVGVERKTLQDFFGSLVRKRLFEQVRRLREAYPETLLILEGDVGKVREYKHPNAFWGAFLALEIDYRTPIVFTADHDQTAQALHVLTVRQSGTEEAYGLRHKPKMLNLEERQRFLVEGLPDVGGTLSRHLLERFGSVRGVFAAEERELRRVPGIGPAKARAIAEVLTAPWEGTQRRLAHR
jgi:Fanconi anemia group M protein